jgi:hypothetical protein
MTVTERTVPPRPKRPEPVNCNTCLDQGVVLRIRGGKTFAEPCPECKAEQAPRHGYGSTC